MRNLPVKILLFVLIVTVLPARAQQKALPHRPKVAVVLSGGGAKGMAHVGFLKVMEEAGIHPDIIVGTSMGSIVGGFYSLGYSADSIKKLMQQQDWNEVLSNKISLGTVNIEEKREYGNYIIEFPIKGWKPTLPSGAIKGHQLELLFDDLSFPASQDTLFDNFPIAYRAVAVDILTGQTYVFDRGELTTAMRSSMSIPTIMEPVKYKGHLFIDGGVINNFPVDVAKAMGADIIIGVYVGGHLKTIDKMDNMMSVLMISSLLNSINDAKKKIKDCDVYIEPPVDDMTAADFFKVDTFIARGYNESLKYKKQLVSIAKKLDQYPPKEIKGNYLIDSLMITQYETNPLQNKFTKRMVARMLGSDLGGYSTPRDIHKTIDNLYGTRLFEKIGYEITPLAGNHYKIKYNFVEAPTKSLDFSFNYSTDKKIGLAFHLVMRNFLMDGSKFETRMNISEYPDFYVRYLKYLGQKQLTSVDFSYNIHTYLMTFYNASNQISEQYYRFFRSYNLNVNQYLTRQSKLSLGLYSNLYKYHSLVDLGFGNPEQYRLNTKSISLSWEFDNRNDKYFPKKGHKSNVALVYNMTPLTQYQYSDLDTTVNFPNQIQSFKDTNYFQFRYYWRAYKNRGKFTFENSLDAYFSTTKGLTMLNSFLIGGVNGYERFLNVPFWGMPLNYDFSNMGLIYGFGTRWEFYRNTYAVAKINGLFEPQQFATIPTDIFEGSSYGVGAGLGLAYNSPIGPVTIILSKSNFSRAIWTYFNIGFYL